MPRRPSDDPAGPPHPTFRFLYEEKPAHIQWLWPQRIPLGALTLLIGDPATGKSLLTVDLAARLTTANPWPDRPAAESPAPVKLPPLADLTDEAIERAFPAIRGFLSDHINPAGVLFAAPEDNAALHDRLTAAGANLLYVSVLDGVRPRFTKDLLPFRLPGHATQLEEAIRAHDHPRLVVLDPIHTLLDAGVYSSPDHQAALLGTLADLARRKGVAILAVGHLTKTTARRVLYRIRGSLCLTAAARSILLVTQHPTNPNARILTQLKNAYGPPAPPLSFQIAEPPARSPAQPFNVSATSLPPREGLGEGSSPVPTFPPSHAPHLRWSDSAGADWPLSTGTLDLSPESFSILSEACDWLTDYLSTGPKPAREVLTAARQAGIPRITLIRAKRLLNVKSQKTPAGWLWLPA